MIFAVAKKKDLFGMKRMQKLLVVQSAQAMCLQYKLVCVEI